MPNGAENYNRRKITETNVPHEENEMKRMRLKMSESEREKQHSRGYYVIRTLLQIQSEFYEFHEFIANSAKLPRILRIIYDSQIPNSFIVCHFIHSLDTTRPTSDSFFDIFSTVEQFFFKEK